ncbi:MAG: ABC transporter substrate-binding protein [Telmatospirillum sp.]|nr:ABC transporter substrate-binding protein [Telmatospirillum sp.]
MIRLDRRRFLAASTAVLAAPSLARAQEAFRVVAFAGASNWLFWVAERKGMFEAVGLKPELAITPNSVELARNLAAGRYELALTSVDNVVAYNEGQGEAELGAPADFVALFGIDNGLLSLMAEPGTASIAALKGKTVSVDALTTGFAFVQREILAMNGIAFEDVQTVRVGGGAQRLEALLKREQSATLLNAPLDLVAEGRGFVRLARATQALGAYQGIVGTTRRSAVAVDGARLTAFMRAFHRSVAWLYDPANREEALAILMDRMRGMERPGAEGAYRVLLDPQNGIYRDLRIDREGLRTVLRLRQKYAVPAKTLGDPERYIDESLRRRALGIA